MYDLGKIRSIPCEEVARMYGMQLKKVGDKLWGKLRSEKTPSFCIYTSKNRWCDFGTGKNGSNIDLVMEIQSCTTEEAIKELAETFGIDNEKSSIKWNGVTDSEYKELGIQPEKATMNFNFDLRKHTVRQLEIWSNKYNMSVRELSRKHPKTYDRLIEKFAVEKINSLKETYYSELKLYNLGSLNDISKLLVKDTLENLETSINRTAELYSKAMVSKVYTKNLKVNLKSQINTGNKKIEVGDIVQVKDLKAGNEKAQLIFIVNKKEEQYEGFKITNDKIPYITNFKIEKDTKNNLGKDSYIKMGTKYVIDENKITNKVGHVSEGSFEKINKYMKLFESKGLIKNFASEPVQKIENTMSMM